MLTDASVAVGREHPDASSDEVIAAAQALVDYGLIAMSEDGKVLRLTARGVDLIHGAVDPVASVFGAFVAASAAAA